MIFDFNRPSFPTWKTGPDCRDCPQLTIFLDDYKKLKEENEKLKNKLKKLRKKEHTT